MSDTEKVEKQEEVVLSVIVKELPGGVFRTYLEMGGIPRRASQIERAIAAVVNSVHIICKGIQQETGRDAFANVARELECNDVNVLENKIVHHDTREGAAEKWADAEKKDT